MSNKNLFYLCLSGFFLSFQVRNNHCAGSITSDVYSGTSHIKDTVYSGYQSNAINRKTNRSKYHSQHDHTCSRYTGGSDGSKCCSKYDRQHLRKCQMDSVTGCDKDITDTLIDCCTVHIDRSSKRKYERCDFAFGTKFFGTFQVDRKSSYRRSTGESKHDCRKHAFKEFQRT